MSNDFKSLRWRTGLAAMMTGLMLAACGGGGGGDATAVAPGNPPPVPVVAILDSFGNAVSGGADGVGPGDSGGDGTAGDGTAIVGGLVTVTDVNGKSVSATTDAQGYYRVKMTGMTAPFVISVKRPDGIVRHSLSVKAPVSNAFINMNISGITDKVASDVARAGGRSGAADLTPQIVASNAAVIDQSVSSIRSALATVIAAANVSNFDPLGTPFRPDGKGIDFVLDNTVVTVAADGSTQVGVSPNFKPSTPPASTLVGTWHMYVTAEGTTVDTGANFAGKDIPTAQTVSQYGVADFSGFVAPVTSGGYTMSVSGNVITTTGPSTNLTDTVNSFFVGNYQSCGSCGVGSEVSYQLNVTIVEQGVLNGVQISPTTFTTATTIKWVRVS